jgi:glycosyltransferase involved in cell wall biosynthesis
MHILFVTGEYPPAPGGIGDYTQQLAAALCDRDHTVDVLTIQAGELIYYTMMPDSADQRQVLGPARGWGWGLWPALHSAIKRLRPDVLHIQYQTGAYAMRPAINLLPWRLRSLGQPPLIAVTFHDLLEPYLFPKAGPLRRWVSLRLARDADLVIATNQPDHDQLSAYRQPTAAKSDRSLALIPIGSNIALTPPTGYSRAGRRAELGLAPGSLLIAYFGLLSASKGADLLVEALAPLPEAHLLIIGGEASAPPDRAFAQQLAARIAALGLGGRITQTGHLSPPEVSANLLAADIVALPFRDGASFRRGSLLAALAHGCAVITTAPTDSVTAARLRDGEHVMLIPPSSGPALSAALAKLAAEPALRSRLGAGGQTLAASFSWPTIAQGHEQIYRSGRS